jgi:hypothetical protein
MGYPPTILPTVLVPTLAGCARTSFIVFLQLILGWALVLRVAEIALIPVPEKCELSFDKLRHLKVEARCIVPLFVL